MKSIIRLLAFLPLAAAAQGQGIKFVHAANWEEVLQQARAEKKLIFVDAYTTWCGPCRYLSTQIFPKDEVGKFYNDKFISVKLQLDTTAGDNAYVKQWYPTAGKMMKDMNINVFPTLLFFDANGQPIHRVAGAGDAERIIGYARTALDSSRRFYALRARYEAGARDEQTLRALTRSAVEAYDYKLGSKVFNEWLAQQKDPFNKENAELAEVLALSIDDAAFKMIESSRARFDSLLGRSGAAETKIRDVVMRELMAAAARSNMGGEFTTVQSNLRARFGRIADEMAARAVMNHYRSAGDWTRFATAAVDYFRIAGSKATASEQNDVAWAFFEHISDKNLLNEALRISAASLSANDPNHTDTYANLLHKVGRTQEAIQWEQKAMDTVPEDQKASFKANIEKMKRGEKTW